MPPPKRARPADPSRGQDKTSRAQAVRESLVFSRRALGLVWRSSKSLTLALGGLTLASAAVPPAIAIAGKRIVDAVVAGARDETLRWVLVELALVVLQTTFTRATMLVRSVLGSRLGVDINVVVLERATGLGLEHFEDAEFYDRLSRARREASSRPMQLVIESFSLVQSALTLLGYGALLVRFSPWVVLALAAATVPATIAEMRYSKAAFRLRNWRSPDSRRLIYLEYVLANDEHVKEVKLFGLGPLFLGRYRELAERFHGEDSRLAVRRSIVTQVLALLATLAFYGAYGAMALMTAVGRLTLGSMTMYVLAFRSGQQAFQSLLAGIGNIYEHNLYMSNLFAYLDGTADKVPAGAGTASAATALVPLAPDAALEEDALALAPGATREVVAETAVGDDAQRPAVEVRPDERGIRLEGVSFRYPGQAKDDAWVLRDVDLFIPRGQSVALVGQNGAGKTTLVKLVTRLYAPTKGRVSLDGKDLQRWDHDALLARFGVVLQDFNQYQLTARENVGLGSVSHVDDLERIARAVEQGGAAPVVDGLASGLDSQLGRWFQGGVELSGGQWQKLALARGFMREEADILVLDEPTAALDAEAEHAVFERFRALAKGKTTIIVSHRFPTVRMADRILVLAGGGVVEDGTHDELVALGGTYARLYALQAAGYT